MLLLMNSFVLAHAQQNLPVLPFESNNNATATYAEAIAFYETLAGQSPLVKLEAHGSTDSGHPLHLAILSKGGTFDPKTAREQGKLVLFINNAIHPGEPCGVDASMMLFRDFAQDKALQAYLDRLVIVNIPFYNIGGGLNRGSYSRANQLGPEAHGFRGNAKNLDLNRDFIKCDSRNAQTFNQIFASWQPDIFMDNHTSNGADYPYTMTLIASQLDKLQTHLATYAEQQLIPKLYSKMEQSGWEMTPYVYARTTPDEGIAAFLDLPRFGSGYAALHNTIGFIPETHMLKPFKDRVMSTYTLMMSMVESMYADHNKIKEARAKAQRYTMVQDTFDIKWEIDFSQQDKLLFKGYEAKYKKSEVSGLDRLWYDHEAPYEKEIPYFRYYKAVERIKKPVAYIFPQAYQEILERMEWNGVVVRRLAADTTLEVEMYYIEDYNTVEQPYEGHYLHSDVAVEAKTMNWKFYAGDLVVFTNQPINRYIIETLEPQAPDAFFAWNFFDGILMRKEYFSSYVFEDLAAEMLQKDPELKAALEARRASDQDFASSARAQLNFIYQRSPYAEPTFNLYPVARLKNNIELPLK